MRRMIQVTATILACTGFFIFQTGCGSDDPGDPGGGTSCDIEITFPAAGEDYQTGEIVNLRWDHSTGGEVRISLVKAGAEQGEIAAATGNDGFFRWTASTMGATSGTDFGVAIIHTDDSACGDTLALTLVNTEGCAISVDSPDSLHEGDDYLITWDSENTTGAVDVELWYYTGVEDIRVDQLAIGTDDDGEWLWEDVDSFHLGSSNNFFFRVAALGVAGCEGESQHFEIEDPNLCEIDVIWPNSTSVYDEGDEMFIQFETFKPTGTAVDLLLYQGTVDRVEYIASGVPMVDGQLTWTIAIADPTGLLEEHFTVKIVDANDQHCVGFSQRFTIHLDP